MVERGGEKEEMNGQTDRPTDSPSFSSVASDPLIFPTSFVTSSPVADVRTVFLSTRRCEGIPFVHFSFPKICGVRERERERDFPKN